MTHQENKKYVFVQKEGADWTGIKLLDEKYKDVIFKYGKVAFAKDENPDGTLSIYDWKRSKDIEMKTPFKKNSVLYELRHLQDVNGVHYSLQLNIYKKILERNYNKNQ